MVHHYMESMVSVCQCDVFHMEISWDYIYMGIVMGIIMGI